MTQSINLLQFICPTDYYGAERWVMALCKNLDPEVFRCDLAVTLEESDTDLKLVNEFRRLGNEVFVLSMKYRFDPRIINELVAVLRKRKIHIIHTHGYKPDIIGVLAARRAGIPCVITPHGFENARDLKLRFYIWLGCKAMRFADQVVPLSTQLCEKVSKHGVKNQQLTYIRNGVDLSEVEAARNDPETDCASDEKRIGFVGQMISRKNIVHILDIFDRLQQEHSKLRLLLLGDGDQRAELERYAQQLSSRDKIKFLGFRDDRLALLKSFDLFVMTSTLEGIPRCLMEAAAMGIPVAAYDIPGIDQLIQHKKSGLLAQLGDKERLQSYWERLLFDTSYAQTLATEARRFVNENYSANRMAQEYEVLFNRLVQKEV